MVFDILPKKVKKGNHVSFWSLWKAIELAIILTVMNGGQVVYIIVSARTGQITVAVHLLRIA